jgi:hypothetical protein
MRKQQRKRKIAKLMTKAERGQAISRLQRMNAIFKKLAAPEPSTGYDGETFVHLQGELNPD